MRKTIMGVVPIVVAAMSLYAFGGERAFLKCDDSKPLRFAFSDAHSLEFLLPGMKEIFAAIPPASACCERQAYTADDRARRMASNSRQTEIRTIAGISASSPMAASRGECASAALRCTNSFRRRHGNTFSFDTMHP